MNDVIDLSETTLSPSATEQENQLKPADKPHTSPQTTARLSSASAAIAGTLALSACGGGGGSTSTTSPTIPGGVIGGDNGDQAPNRPTVDARPTALDAARFLTQATFGIRSSDEIDAIRTDGFELWLWNQFRAAPMIHTKYLDEQRTREAMNRVTEEMSYEAVWQQWLKGEDQLRARVVFALGQIMVISNIAPDIRAYAMSSYMDMLNRNAFGNYRTLLKEVTLHPAMGYFLNMIESEKDDVERGIHPNENYAREVLQLFSIGLVELNLDGSAKTGADGKTTPTYSEKEVKGFAKAFSGWTFASQNPGDAKQFHDADENLDSNWVTPMRAFPSAHSTEAKNLLNGTVLAGGQSPEKDMDDALDNIFNHPNVGPFISRQLIQHLVTSNPSKAYITRAASIFNNNGSGTRGDLKALVKAILLDPEARAKPEAQAANFGKQREPVIRFATFLRALGATSQSGINDIHYLDSTDDGLGQSPLLAPSVFNFFSPNFRQPGAIAKANLYSPEFQITTETSVVGSLNFFANFINDEGYGYNKDKLTLNLTPLEALATTPAALVDQINALFFTYLMSANTRDRMINMLNAMRSSSSYDKTQRVKAALIVTAISPDFVIQK